MTLSKFATAPLTTSHTAHTHNRVLASANRASVFQGTIRTDVFGGWWSPTDASFGVLEVSGVRVDLLVTYLWDGGLDGRVGTIVASAPPRDRAHLKDFFREIDTPAAVHGPTPIVRQCGLTDVGDEHANKITHFVRFKGKEMLPHTPWIGDIILRS